MIDYSSFKISSFNNTEFNKLTELVDVDCPIDNNHVYFDLYNLRVDYYPNDNSIRIRNSLHKFFNASIRNNTYTNHDNFHFTDMVATADVLSILYFNRPTTDFELSTKLEIGVNVDSCGYKPFDIMERYLSYQVRSSNNSFFTCEPWGKGKPIMRKSYLSDYNLKFYDKGRQSRLGLTKVLRYEIVFEQLRKIRAVLGKENLSMQTLCEIDSWVRFGEYLMEVYQNIKKLPIIDKDSISVDELNKIHAHCSKQFKDDLKRALVPSQYNATRLGNKSTYDLWDSNQQNIHNSIGKNIENKVNELINVSVSTLVSNSEPELIKI